MAIAYLGNNKMNILGLLISSIVLFYFLYFSFIVWLKPKQYMKNIHERKAKLKLKFPFIPNWFIGFIFFYERPKLSIWWSRSIALFGVVGCVIAIIAAILGSS